MSAKEAMGQELRLLVEQWKDLRARSTALQREALQLRVTSKELRANNAVLLDDLRIIRASSLFADLKAMQDLAGKENGATAALDSD